MFCALGSVCFDWIWFPEINFRKIARLAALENSVKLKSFSVWPENMQKTTEIGFSRYFCFKHFPETRTSSHKLSPRTRTRTSSRLSPSALLSHGSALWSLHCAGTTHTDAPRSRSRRDRNCADRRRSRSRSRRSASIVIIEISKIAIAISREASIDASHDRDRDLAIEIGEIAIAISPIEIAPIAIAIAISPRKYAVLLGFIWVFRNWWHYVFVW